MRDAVFTAVLLEPAVSSEPDPVPAAALRLRSQLAVSGTTALEPPESALLGHWPDRLSRSPLR